MNTPPEAESIVGMKLDPREACAAVKYLLLVNLLDTVPNDSEEAESIRDYMDDPWYKMGSLTDAVRNILKDRKSNV